MFFYADNMRSAAHRCGRNVCTAGGRGRPPLRMRIQKPSPLGTSDGHNTRPQVPPAQSCPPCVREGGSRSETGGLSCGGRWRGGRRRSVRQSNKPADLSLRLPDGRHLPRQREVVRLSSFPFGRRSTADKGYRKGGALRPRLFFGLGISFRDTPARPASRHRARRRRSSLLRCFRTLHCSASHRHRTLRIPGLTYKQR